MEIDTLFTYVLISLVIGIIGYIMLFKKTDPKTGQLTSRFLTESPPKKSIDKMTKRELIELASHHGIDIVRDLKKVDMLTTLKNCGVKSE
jgi:hypothetical protein|tara:strand:- start:2262 stop:2531 length:270 start_codon:yes stop_codon:yes gene_type:complete